MYTAVKMDTIWQISVLTEINKIITVNVPKNCTTAKLYDELKKHPLAPVAGKLTLSSTEEESLEYSHEKHLSDYDIVNKGTVQITMTLDGGLWPSVDDLEARQRLLKASEKIQITTSNKQPDVFGLDDDTPRAVMACGHAVAPLSLALHCYHELEKGEESIRCPDPECGIRWKFSQIREAACLSTDEGLAFESKAIFNRMRKKQDVIKSCPKCSAFCTRSNSMNKRVVCSNCAARSGKQFEFCWICLREWKGNFTEKCGNPECGNNKALFDILATCAVKDIEGFKCPSKRACPKCFTLIEHARKCKHMTCVGCKYEFCFICLKRFPCGAHAWEACLAAPRQTYVESPQSETRFWQLLINYDSEERFILNVTANCYVQELFRTLYNHPRAPKVCGYRVVHGDKELDNRERKRLSEYGIQNRSYLHLSIRLQGG